MSDRVTRASQLAKLKEIDDRLAGLPDKLGLLFERARLLASLGRVEEAKQAYAEILQLAAPAEFAALNNLGNLLHEAGAAAKAALVFKEAVLRDPDNPIGHFNLARVLYEGRDLPGARQHYEAALKIEPDHAGAHQGLAQVLIDQGDAEGARAHYDRAFRDGAIRVSPYRGEGQPIPLLLLVSVDESNVPIRPHLSNRLFEVTAVVVDYFDPSLPLPPHALLFNAVGDADLSRSSLQAAARIVAQTSAPVLNQPAAVLATGRVANAERLGRLPGVVTPRIGDFSRESLSGTGAAALLANRGFVFPLLLRSPGFHTGRHFVRVETVAGLSAALASLPGDPLTVLQFLDARSADGKLRKYRVMMVDGQLYPLHAAVSRDWKVHYFSAEMAGSPEHRAEDRAFLENMPQVLGDRAMAALATIQRELGLDYAGIDFSLGKEGEVIAFEANATMTIPAPPAGETWDYRRAPVQRLLDALGKLLLSRAKPGK